MYPAIALHVMMTFPVWMTSHAVPPVTKFKTYDAAVKVITGQEATVKARSRIHCAILCRTNPYCIANAFDAETSLCFLHPKTTTNSTATGELHNNGTKRLLVLTDNVPDCSESSINATYESVTSVRRSLWSVEGNVTCNDDYYPPLVPVTCLGDGSWTPASPRCQKRIWRYPETKMILDHITFPIPGAVIKGWSLCVEGIPTNNTVTIVEIFQTSNSNRPVYTSWRFANYLAMNDMISGLWGPGVHVYTPSFPLVVGKPFFYRLTVNTSTSVDIFMDNVFYKTFQLRFPPSSFTLVNIYGDVNVTKVETWCKG